MLRPKVDLVLPLWTTADEGVLLKPNRHGQLYKGTIDIEDLTQRVFSFTLLNELCRHYCAGAPPYPRFGTIGKSFVHQRALRALARARQAFDSGQDYFRLVPPTSIFRDRS